MVKLNVALLASGLFSTLVAAAPAPLEAAAYLHFPDHAVCPITAVTNFAKTFTGDKIKAAVMAYPDPTKTDDKLKGYPKEFRLADDGGAWPFTSTTACDSYKSKKGEIFEVPIGGAGQAWGNFGTDPGVYRVLFAFVGTKGKEDHIYCGMTAHASAKDMSHIVPCVSTS